MENDILKKKIIENGQLYTPIVVPDILKDSSSFWHTTYQATMASGELMHHSKTDIIGKA